jgi:hypothetical protein
MTDKILHYLALICALRGQRPKPLDDEGTPGTRVQRKLPHYNTPAGAAGLT